MNIPMLITLTHGAPMRARTVLRSSFLYSASARAPSPIAPAPARRPSARGAQRRARTQRHRLRPRSRPPRRLFHIREHALRFLVRAPASTPHAERERADARARTSEQHQRARRTEREPVRGSAKRDIDRALDRDVVVDGCHRHPSHSAADIVRV